MKISYSQLYRKLTSKFSPKTKEIFDRRFGILTGEPETLESIGKKFNITRERVRQIEESGFNFIRKNYGDKIDPILIDLDNFLKEYGGFRREEKIFESLGGEKQKPYILFFLNLGEKFNKVCEKKEYYAFWTNFENPISKVKGNLDVLISELSKIGIPVKVEDFYKKVSDKYPEKVFASYLEIAKRIQKNKDGLIGLIEWPEIQPRGIKDKAYFVFKKYGKPLHFREVAILIDQLGYGALGKKTYPQTVHNELIKDPRFVLVGRGTYALAEWGYIPGTIKDVIAKILEERGSLGRDELVREVLSQRLVAKNTILMNLNNKNYFEKNEEGKYFLKGAGKAQTA